MQTNPKCCYDLLSKMVSEENMKVYKIIVERLRKVCADYNDALRAATTQLNLYSGAINYVGNGNYAELGKKFMEVKEATKNLVMVRERLAEAEVFYALIEQFNEMSEAARMGQITSVTISYSMYQVITNNESLLTLCTGFFSSDRGMKATDVIVALHNAYNNASALVDVEQYLESDSFTKRILTGNIPSDFINHFSKL